MSRAPLPPSDLPIEDVMGEILAALTSGARLVLAAPPGAGKTTRVPLAMAGLTQAEGVTEGRILVLEPRRIAARMAAKRMAQTLGERVGETVGLSTRIDRKVSGKTRIEVITDGLFTRRILADPGVDGIGAVVFDEFHERSLNIDLALALALESQGALRDDLKLLVMSATLDTAKVAAAIDAPSVESKGRQFPVETRYAGRGGNTRMEDHVATVVQRALRETDGSILTFLPGAGEIRRVAERLEGQVDADIRPLFGALSPADQDAAIAPSPSGTRKVVLATDIAESALTIDGVHVVVDAGLARVPDYDPSGGSAKLVTVRASRASADQRRGRAGRLGPGVCYRLWDEAETRGLTAAPTPEILNADLSGLVLSLADWGEREPARLTWMDAPPEGRIAAAREQLAALGALDNDGALTPRGKAMADLPLPPRMAALIVGATEGGERALAAEIAALAGERGVGGNSTNLADRLGRFRTERSQRAKVLQRQAARWGNNAKPKGDAAHVLASAWPDRIAKAKDGQSGLFLLASGRAGRVDVADALAKSKWLVVADMIGGGSTSRITLAAPLSEADALRLGDVESAETASFDIDTGRIQARRVKQMGTIILSEAPMKRPAPDVAARAILTAIHAHGFAAIGAADMIAETEARLALLVAHNLAEPQSPPLDTLDVWLRPFLIRETNLPTPAAIRGAYVQSLPWEVQEALRTYAPLEVALPCGRKADIDYLSDRAPLITARVQEMYSAARHPAIARGAVPVTIDLTSPARRPVAATRDIVAFWTGGYIDMAKDMRAQYPKHDWPTDPASAKPHEGRTKKRLSGG